MEQIDVIKRLIRAYPDDLQYATSAQGKYWLPSLLLLPFSFVRLQFYLLPLSEAWFTGWFVWRSAHP